MGVVPFQSEIVAVGFTADDVRQGIQDFLAEKHSVLTVEEIRRKPVGSQEELHGFKICGFLHGEWRECFAVVYGPDDQIGFVPQELLASMPDFLTIGRPWVFVPDQHDFFGWLERMLRVHNLGWLFGL